VKILIVVTHLLGTGHLARAVTLARSFQHAGHKVRVASGGQPAPQIPVHDVDLLQLPPVKSDGINFTRLLQPDGRVADEAYLRQRQTVLLQDLGAFESDILITELFPFGRRILTAEFQALLEAARQSARPPLILSSVRDILAPPSKPSKAEKAAALIDRLYDGVLVHSDPAITTLDVSWPVSGALSGKLHYTGYIAPPNPTPHPEQAGVDEILVTAGGGNVGDHLFATAVEAAKLDTQQTWRLLIGGNAAPRIADLRALGGPAVLEPARPDLRQMLMGAKASVSMCGYNTAMDLLQTGCPSVLIPFDAGDEVEQTLRGQSLGQMPGFEVVKSSELSPQTLLAALQRVTSAPRREVGSLELDGARRSVEIAIQLAEQRA
jgi:predicted glycosyltransferase